jgi:two-component system phosphate regulon sensor histidine kinase PhoR
MVDAVDQQAAAARQATLDAYRGQLRLLRTTVDEMRKAHTDRLTAAEPNGHLEQRFAALVLDGSVDGALFLDDDRNVLFPQLVSDRRLASADTQLLALQRLAPDDSKRPAASRQLAAAVNDYNLEMPTPQRLFVMGELRRMAPDVVLPTEQALRLSIQIVEGGSPLPGLGGFQPTLNRDLWALTSTSGRVIGLYRTRRLQTMLDEALRPTAPAGLRFVGYAPDATGDSEAIAAGPSLPGWQISFARGGSSPEHSGARARLLTNLGAAFVGVVTLAVVGLLSGQRLARQLRLARLKTDLTAAVSHELRAPLASIRVLVDGLLGDTHLDVVKTREYLQLIAGEHARLSRVIENFLTFARLERTRQQFQLVPTNPAAVVAASVDAICERAPQGCDLRVEVANDLPQVMADSEALSTALVNLLDNALKFTPAEKHILIRAYADNSSVTFAVRDNGVGIATDEQRRIFDRFYRVDQRLARETAGVGLGLSIVDLIVRAHGGEVQVSSSPGAGSTFALRVPSARG